MTNFLTYFAIVILSLQHLFRKQCSEKMNDLTSLPLIFHVSNS